MWRPKLRGLTGVIKCVHSFYVYISAYIDVFTAAGWPLKCNYNYTSPRLVHLITYIPSQKFIVVLLPTVVRYYTQI